MLLVRCSFFPLPSRACAKVSYPFNREIETATLSALSGIVVPGGGKDERTREFELAVVQEFFFSSFFFLLYILFSSLLFLSRFLHACNHLILPCFYFDFINLLLLYYLFFRLKFSVVLNKIFKFSTNYRYYFSYELKTFLDWLYNVYNNLMHRTIRDEYPYDGSSLDESWLETYVEKLGAVWRIRPGVEVVSCRVYSDGCLEVKNFVEISPRLRPFRLPSLSLS